MLLLQPGLVKVWRANCIQISVIQRIALHIIMLLWLESALFCFCRNDGDRRRGDQRQEEPLENSRDRGDRRHGERSSRRDRSRSREGENRRGIRNGSAKGKAKEPAIDYAELIRGYENMVS